MDALEQSSMEAQGKNDRKYSFRDAVTIRKLPAKSNK